MRYLIGWSSLLLLIVAIALPAAGAGGKLVSPPGGAAVDTATGPVFANPTVRGMRVDHCLYFARQCDEPAASAFCRARGFAHALAWAWEQVSPTVILGDGGVCSQGCGAFSSITCE